VETRTNNRTPTTPFMVQHVATIKLVSPLRGGTCLEIIPLHVQTFTIPIQVTTVTIEHVKGNEKFVKKHAEPIDLSCTILYSG